MRDYLKEYNVEIETIGPVFIGSGKELNKKEYILKQNEIWVMDVQKLYEYMKQRRIVPLFEKFFLNEYRKDLYGFLRENNIKTEDITPYIKYRLRQSDTSLERGNQIPLSEFVKDSYGLPYVPGSSIKGMLRTILLSYEIMSDGSSFYEVKAGLQQGIGRKTGRNKYLRNEQKNIEVQAFNKLDKNEKRISDAVNDILSGLRVSDSNPLAIDDLVLCQRSVYHADGSEKKLNVLRECIKPKTKIRFTLTIDETLCKYTPNDIMNAIKLFSDNYNDVFRMKYPKITKGAADTVYLGGGVGFVSKTSIYPMFGDKMGVNAVVDIFDNTNVPKNHKHYKDRQMGVAPHILKTVHYEGKMYQMGECRWMFV